MPERSRNGVLHAIKSLMLAVFDFDEYFERAALVGVTTTPKADRAGSAVPVKTRFFRFLDLGNG